MSGYKKAAVATCARAALSSLNKTGNRSLVTNTNDHNLGRELITVKRAKLPKQISAAQSNGALHSLSAPVVQQGKRQAGEVGRLSGSKLAGGDLVPGMRGDCQSGKTIFHAARDLRIRAGRGGV